MSDLTVRELEQLAHFDKHWREAVLDGDDPVRFWELSKRDYLEVLRRTVPLFKLNTKGHEALSEIR